MQTTGRVPGAEAILGALEETYAEGSATPDMGGTLTTAEFADRFFRHLRSRCFILPPRITGG
jgi:isocitrate/isopropylmalate dehydrogenase